VVIGLALVAILIRTLIRTHKINRFEIIYFAMLVPRSSSTSLSHGVVALAFGDDTAKRAGRLTLNPAKHVDPVGTLLVPAVLSLSGLGAYGWAKPVPVSTNRLRSPRNHTVVVSLVGPLTNFALAAVLGSSWSSPPPRGSFNKCTSTGTSVRVRTLRPCWDRSFSSAGSPTSSSAPSTSSRARPWTGHPVLERFLPARVLPEYYRIQPLLMFLPFVLILAFHNQWSLLIGHLINWWSGLLV